MKSSLSPYLYSMMNDSLLTSDLVNWGVPFGILPTGKRMQCTDVLEFKWDSLQKMRGGTQFGPGVHGSYPTSRKSFQQKVPAAYSSWKWFWKLGWSSDSVPRTTGIWKVQSSDQHASSVAAGINEGIGRYSLGQQGNERHPNPFMPSWEKLMMGYLNDIEGCIFPRRKWLRPSNPQNRDWCRR